MPNNQIQSLTVDGTTYDIVDKTSGYATEGYVDAAITALPEPMIFKGSLGTDGTITSLPTAATSNEGFTYKVITAGTYASQTAKVGDIFISDGNNWILIPSGDEPSGTVTSVEVSNATNGGLSVSGSPVTSSGTITIGHSNVLTNAQTTSAVYPIKIDKNGHISEYGSAVTIPTKVSDLTNDSGYITSYTDEKMKWTASTSSNTYYPLQSTSTATTSTANTLNGINFYQYYNTAGGYRRLNLGNTTAWKSSGGAYGTIRLYGAAATYYGDLVPGVLGTTSGDGHISANRTWTLPDKTGTIALTSDIPTITDTYSGTSSNGMSGKAVKSAIDALDGTISGSAGSGKTLTAFSQTDGKVSATFGAISITKSQISDFPAIPSNTSDLNNDSQFVSQIDLADNLVSTLYYLNVSGSTASLINANASVVGIFELSLAFRSVKGVQVAQVLNISGDLAETRMYEIVDADTINRTVRLVAVEGSTVYIADLTDAGSGLTGTISTTTMLTSETDPTVPSWAKAASKPTYTASEVGALASNTTYVSKITTTAGAHTAISNKSGAVSFKVPTKTSHLTNDSGFLTSHQSIKTITGINIVGTGDVLPSAVDYTTTVPSAVNTSGLKFVLCDSEPSTKYDGWVYLIKES